MYLFVVKAQECPTPPTAIDIKIENSVNYDKKQNEYIYSYKVRNGSNAKVGLYLIAIESKEPATTVQLPSKWQLYHDPADTSLPSRMSFMSGISQLDPNSNEITFIVKSKLPPGITKYYAEGRAVKDLKAVTINGDNEATPDCPGYFIDEASNLNQMIQGITIGPVPTNQKEAKLKMKLHRKNYNQKYDDEDEEPEISPEDKGNVEVLIYNIEDTDLSEVNLGSIKFGPYFTTPYFTELISKDSKLKHWRKKPNKDGKIIQALFKLTDLKIRCDLDTALVLNAKAGEKEIVGFVKIKPKTCNKFLMKSHRDKKKYFFSSKL